MTKKTIRIFAGLIAIIILIVGLSLIYDAVDTSAREEGHNVGVVRGYNNGYARGYMDGYIDGTVRSWFNPKSDSTKPKLDSIKTRVFEDDQFADLKTK